MGNAVTTHALGVLQQRQLHALRYGRGRSAPWQQMLARLLGCLKTWCLRVEPGGGGDFEPAATRGWVGIIWYAVGAHAHGEMKE